jgi:transcriptional regulator with XRE-family HTH domain
MARPREGPGEADPSTLAERLGRLRMQRGWTLAALSELTRLSKPYLSRLESGRRQPSLAALLTLARVYQTPLQSLLDAGAHHRFSPVLIQSGRTQIQRGNGLRYRAISGGGALVNLSAVHVTVPRRRRRTALAQHDGEELLYVLSGRLSLVFENENHTLQPGDSAHFDATIPHRLAASGDRDAEVLLVAHVPTRVPARDRGGVRPASPGRSRRQPRAAGHRSLDSIAICASLADARA